MIAKLTICATVLLLAPVPQTRQSSPNAKQVSVEKAKAERPKEAEKSTTLDLLPIEANIIKYTNAQRTRYGLPALKIDAALENSARRHASWMARNQNMVHTHQPVAENIAMGQPNSAAVVRAWMNSSGHRANILNRGYRRIGAAAYRTPGGTIYWCQQFLR